MCGGVGCVWGVECVGCGVCEGYQLYDRFYQKFMDQ